MNLEEKHPTLFTLKQRAERLLSSHFLRKVFKNLYFLTKPLTRFPPFLHPLRQPGFRNSPGHRELGSAGQAAQESSLALGQSAAETFACKRQRKTTQGFRGAGSGCWKLQLIPWERRARSHLLPFHPPLLYPAEPF